MPLRLQIAAALLIAGTLSNATLRAQTPAQNPSDLLTPKPSASSTEAPAKAAAPQPYDPLLDLPPLPPNKVSLMGGTISALDEVQNHLVIQPFGAKQKLRLNFDMRTHIYNDGKPAAARELKSGERVYIDTMLNGGKVFAKSIWIQSLAGTGDARGQIIGYDNDRKILSVRDEVSAQPIDFRIAPNAVIHRGSTTGSVADLTSGSLVSLNFGPQQGRSGVVREVTLLAQPGTVFTFFGRVTFLDLSKRLVAISNQSDNKSYDLSLESIPTATLRTLREGGTAGVSAVFDGNRYVAQKIDFVQANAGTNQDDQK
jgi:hypothetical protein